MVHEFRASQAVEREWSPILDRLLERLGEWRPASRREEWAGKDRVLLKSQRSVEYKIDTKAKHTGNFFIETTSNDRTKRPGWALTCIADYLWLYVVPDRLIIVRPADLRKALPAWRRYPLRRAPNRGYDTLGLCVPLREVEAIAIAVGDPRS